MACGELGRGCRLSSCDLQALSPGLRVLAAWQWPGWYAPWHHAWHGAGSCLLGSGDRPGASSRKQSPATVTVEGKTPGPQGEPVPCGPALELLTRHLIDEGAPLANAILSPWGLVP